MSDQPERQPKPQDQESDDWAITVGYFQAAPADASPAEPAKPKRHDFSEDGEIRPLEAAEIQTFEQLAAQLVPQYLDSTQALHKEVSHLINLSQHWLDLSAEISELRAEFRNPIYLNLICFAYYALILMVLELSEKVESITLFVCICINLVALLKVVSNDTNEKKSLQKRNRNDLHVIEDDFDDLANLLNAGFTAPTTGQQLRKRGVTAVKTIRKIELEQEAKAAANRAYEASVERARRRINNNRD